MFDVFSQQNQIGRKCVCVFKFDILTPVRQRTLNTDKKLTWPNEE